MNMHYGTLLCAGTLTLLSTTAMAGERLSGDEIRTLLTGKTVHGTHHKRGTIETHFGEDGRVTNRSGDGTTRAGKWWVDGDKRCIRWDHKGKDFCHYIEREDDGSHVLIHSRKGKRLVEMTTVSDGSPVD